MARRGLSDLSTLPDILDIKVCQGCLKPRRDAAGQMMSNLYLYLKHERGKNNQF